MQESEVKECDIFNECENRLIGSKNEIKNVERMKEIVIDAVGLEC